MKSTFYSDEEQKLVQDSLKGDHFAQKCIYQKYAQAMFNVAVRMTADESLSKDIIQESFIKVFSKLDRFQGNSSLGAWIKRITINTAIDQLRLTTKFRTEPIEYVYDQQEETVDDQTELNVKRIHQAIKELPEKCRVIFNLYQMEGYKHAEIAEWLNISESTSKSQYVRAKKLLRISLKKRLHES